MVKHIKKSVSDFFSWEHLFWSPLPSSSNLGCFLSSSDKHLSSWKLPSPLFCIVLFSYFIHIFSFLVLSYLGIAYILYLLEKWCSKVHFWLFEYWKHSYLVWLGVKLQLKKFFFKFWRHYPCFLASSVFVEKCGIMPLSFYFNHFSSS